MRNIAILALMLLAVPAAVNAAPAAAPKAPPITCGKTADLCQKVVDTQAAQIKALTLMAQGLRQQRDANAQAASDAQVNAYVASAQQPAPMKK